jgi:hypothetical protein
MQEGVGTVERDQSVAVSNFHLARCLCGIGVMQARVFIDCAGLKTPGRRHSNKRAGLCARPARVLLSYTDAIYDSWHKRGVVLHETS